MPDFQFHPEADREYRAAVAWYRGQSARAAERFAAAVDRTAREAVVHPERFPIYESDIRQISVRRFPNFLAYLPTTTGISILSVAHTSREDGFWLGRA